MNLNRLMALRKEKGWSLQYVSDQLGMAKSTYAGYESGYRRPSLEAIKSMADLFDTSVDYILGRTNTSSVAFGQSDGSLELTPYLDAAISVDGMLLSQEEIQHFIAFIRAKREIEQTISQPETSQNTRGT